MEKKNNKIVYAVIGALVVLLIVLVILVGMLIGGKNEEKKGGTTNVGPNVVEDTTADATGDTTDIFGEEITDDTAVTGIDMTVVIGGIQFTVPKDYACIYVESLGPVIYIDDLFTLKLAVLDTPSYAEVASNPAYLTDKISEVGGILLEDAKEVELNGKKYIYYVAILNDVKTVVINSEVVGKRVATQLAVESDTLTYDDCIQVFASIIDGAKETDAPDSTYDDIEAQNDNSNKGEVKSESTLTFGGDTVTFQIPENFYSQSVETWSDEQCEYFMSGDYAFNVTCRLSEKEAGVAENAEQMTYLQWDALLENVKNATTIETVDIDGYTFYYFDVRYEFDGADCQKFFAACEIGNSIYAVDIDGLDAESELTLEMVKKFLMVK